MQRLEAFFRVDRFFLFVSFCFPDFFWGVEDWMLVWESARIIGLLRGGVP